MKKINSCWILSLFISFGCISSGLAQVLPIKPARTISFTTDEGSYMNVDVSPDGNTLVFDLLGDLYTVPSKGGNATQITRGIALNLRPVWDPDGKKIAYKSDESGDYGISVRDIPGKFHAVLGKPSSIFAGYQSELLQNDIVWTPDGKFVASGGYKYGVYSPAIESKFVYNKPLRFSSNGNQLFYLDSGKIYKHDFVINSNTPISAVGGMEGSESNGIISPDGRWRVFMIDTVVTDLYSKRCLIARDLIKGNDRVLISSVFMDTSYIRPYRNEDMHYSFSPDSKEIYIGYKGKIHRIEVDNGMDEIVPFVANVKAYLGPFNYNTFPITHDSVKVKYARSANRSPDGKHLVFSTLNKIYVKDLPNGKTHELAPQPVNQFQPAYSPDGKWIAYVSWSDTSGGFLWRVPSTGGQPEQLTKIAGQYQKPEWSPDGKMIAVFMGLPEFKLGIIIKGELLTVPLDGGSITTIDTNTLLFNKVTFSADGKRVMYAPYPYNNVHLQQVSKQVQGTGLDAHLISNNLEGNDPEIMGIAAGDILFKQICMSPDGRYIVYSADEDIYLLPVCKLNNMQIVYQKTGLKNSLIKIGKGVDPYWENGGKRLCWTYGSKFYGMDPDKRIIDKIIDLNVTAPAFYGHGLIALTDARIITMKAKRVIENGTIIIKDGRIIGIGQKGKLLIPSEAKQYNLAGTTIMPGLIDLHLHVSVPQNIFPQQYWTFLINLAYGVTAARDPSSNYDSYGYKELLETGQMIGPRLYSVGNAVRFNDGVIRLDNLEDAQSVVNKRKELGGTVIKQYALGTRLRKEWLLMACREAGLNMTNEGGEGPPGPLAHIAMIKDGSTGIEHSAEWGDVYKDVISFVAASKTFLTPTLQVCYGPFFAKEYFKYKYWHTPTAKLLRFSSADNYTGYFETEAGAENLETILHAQPKDDTLNPGFLKPAKINAGFRKAGGHVALGSHGNDQGIGAHNELWALQMGGLTNMEALQAATIVGAEAIGVQKDLGSIEVGKIADLIILNKNPLDDIHNSREIRYVMKDGVLYDGDTLDELWPVYKKCPEWKMKPAAPIPPEN